MTSTRLLLAAAALPGLVALAGCELGAKDGTQTGYRGTGMAQITDRSSVKEASIIPPPPCPLSAAASTGPRVPNTDIL